MLSKTKRYTLSQCNTAYLINCIVAIAGVALFLLGVTGGEIFDLRMEDDMVVKIVISGCGLAAIIVCGMQNAKLKELKEYLIRHPEVHSVCLIDLERESYQAGGQQQNQQGYQQQNQAQQPGPKQGYQQHYNPQNKYNNKKPQGPQTQQQKQGWQEPSPAYQPPQEKRNVYCTACGSVMRVPVGKGKLHVTCPKCKNQFDFNT